MVASGGAAPSPAVLDALSDRFEVLDLVDGIALRPIEGLTVRLIEVRDGRVAADGRLVEQAALAALVGEQDADLILQLAGSKKATPKPPDKEPPVKDLEPPEANSEPAARRYSKRTRERVSFGSGITVHPHESADDVIAFFGPVVIRGEVRGTVFSLGGRIEIDGGEVRDSVAVVGGSVRMRRGARVGGDVVSIGGTVEQAPGTRIRGAVTEVASKGVPILQRWPRWLRPSSWTPEVGLLGRVGGLIVLLVASLLIVFASRSGTGSIADRVVNEPIKSSVVGVVVQILAVPVMVFMTVALTVSIVGIPLLLLVPLSVLVLGIALLVGYASSALVVGRALRLRGTATAPVGTGLLVVAGVVLIQGSSLAGAVLLGIGGLLGPLGLLLLTLGFLVQYLAWTAGFGAVVLQTLTPAPNAR